MKGKLLTVNFIFILIEILNDKFCYTQMTNLLHFKINVGNSHCQPQCTLQILCEDPVLFVSVDHVSSCWQQHPKRYPTILVEYPSSFFKLRSSSNRTNKNLTELVLNIQTALIW